MALFHYKTMPLRSFNNILIILQVVISHNILSPIMNMGVINTVVIVNIMGKNHSRSICINTSKNMYMNTLKNTTIMLSYI